MLYRGPLSYDDPIACPICSGPVQTDGYITSTLVGYPAGQDDNHRQQHYFCKPCDLAFTRHWKVHSRRVWLTGIWNMKSYLIKGENGCFEHHIDPRKETT